MASYIYINDSLDDLSTQQLAGGVSLLSHLVSKAGSAETLTDLWNVHRAAIECGVINANLDVDEHGMFRAPDALSLTPETVWLGGVNGNPNWTRNLAEIEERHAAGKDADVYHHDLKQYRDILVSNLDRQLTVLKDEYDRAIREPRNAVAAFARKLITGRPLHSQSGVTMDGKCSEAELVALFLHSTVEPTVDDKPALSHAALQAVNTDASSLATVGIRCDVPQAEEKAAEETESSSESIEPEPAPSEKAGRYEGREPGDRFYTVEEKRELLDKDYRAILSDLVTGQKVIDAFRAPQAPDGTVYRGANAVILSSLMCRHDGWQPVFVTREQAGALGADIYGNAKAIPLLVRPIGDGQTFLRRTVYNICDTNLPEKNPELFARICEGLKPNPVEISSKADELAMDIRTAPGTLATLERVARTRTGIPFHADDGNNARMANYAAALAAVPMLNVGLSSYESMTPTAVILPWSSPRAQHALDTVLYAGRIFDTVMDTGRGEYPSKGVDIGELQRQLEKEREVQAKAAAKRSSARKEQNKENAPSIR